jgi:hypothetical protein
MNNTNKLLVLSSSRIVMSKPGQAPVIVPLPAKVTASVWSGHNLNKLKQIVEATVQASVPALQGKRLDNLISFRAFKPGEDKFKKLGKASLG